MKVYVVYWCYYDSFELKKVFKEKYDAEQYIEKHSDTNHRDYYSEELDLE